MSTDSFKGLFNYICFCFIMLMLFNTFCTAYLAVHIIHVKEKVQLLIEHELGKELVIKIE